MKDKIREILQEIAISGLNDGRNSEELSQWTRDLIQNAIPKILDIIEWS